jgi:hypothetical protein
MAKSPVYIGAGSAELSVQAALSLIENSQDSASYLLTIADWVHLSDGTTVVDQITGVDSLKYSAKEYAQGSTLAAGGSAKNWAQLATTPTTTATDASSKEWAIGVSTHKNDASAKEYAIHAKYGTVDGSTEYSAKHYSAQAQDWASKTDGQVRNDANGADVDYSAKEWATDTNADIGSAKDWATDTAAIVASTDYSSKEWAAGQLAANTSGSAKQWSIGGGAFVEGTAVEGSNYSAKKYASNAAASALLAEGYVDTFDDKYLGSHTTAVREVGANVGKDNDGDPLDDGALYYDTTLEVMKVWDDTGSAWKQLTPTTTEQTNIDTVVANPLATNIGLVAAIDDKVTDVAAIDDKVTTVANITAGDVSKVADITTGDVSKVANITAGDVTKVANITTGDVSKVAVITTGDVSKVAAITTGDVSKVAVITTGDVSKVAAITTGDVSKVADITTGDVTKVANITTGDVTKVADVDGEVVLVAAVDGEIVLLGTANMTHPTTGHLAYLGTAAMANTTDGYLKVLGNATVTADMAILGSTTVTDDMALLAISDVIDDMETCSNNIADINNFADIYQIDDFSPSAPTTDGGGNAIAEGDLAYDSTANRLKYYNGSAFVDTATTTEATTAADNSAVAMSIALG